jgi:hypothetical protein
LTSNPEVREGTAAILVSMDGGLLPQLRDALPRVAFRILITLIAFAGDQFMCIIIMVVST